MHHEAVWHRSPQSDAEGPQIPHLLHSSTTKSRLPTCDSFLRAWRTKASQLRQLRLLCQLGACQSVASWPCDNLLVSAAAREEIGADQVLTSDES
jgi:hypothetical protein